MTVSVDFNLRDEQGWVLAAVEPSIIETAYPGQTVLAEDLEGNRCKAVVMQIDQHRNVLSLALVEGTEEFSAQSDWVVLDMRRAMGAKS